MQTIERLQQANAHMDQVNAAKQRANDLYAAGKFRESLAQWKEVLTLLAQTNAVLAA